MEDIRMNDRKGNRLPIISLCLSLIPLFLYFISIIYIEWASNGDGDWGWLLAQLGLWWVCALIHLGCASVGLGLSIYAVKKKIRMKTSITAIVLSAISFMLAAVVVAAYVLLPLIY